MRSVLRPTGGSRSLLALNGAMRERLPPAAGFFALTFAIAWGLGGAVDLSPWPTRIRHWKIDCRSAVFPLFWFCASLFRNRRRRYKRQIECFARLLRANGSLANPNSMVRGRVVRNSRAWTVRGSDRLSFFTSRESLNDFAPEHPQSLSFSYLTMALTGELMGGPIGEERRLARIRITRTPSKMLSSPTSRSSLILGEHMGRLASTAFLSSGSRTVPHVFRDLPREYVTCPPPY